MSLLAVLRKSGEIIASYDVPTHSSALSSHREAFSILHQEINQTLTSLLEGVDTGEGGSGSGDEDMDDDSEDEDAATVNGNKRRRSVDETNKKRRIS